MEAKLFKREDDFYSLKVDGIVMATSNGMLVDHKLSLKNCQSIENGYDLDELAKTSMDKINILFNNSLESKSHTIGFRAGWQQAMNIYSDKKFSEEDMINFAEYCKGDLMKTKDLFNEYQSVQQTEWDVEIVMGDPIGIGDKYTPDTKPKLDAENCIILKRK